MDLSPSCKACCPLLRTGGPGTARVMQPSAAWMRSSRALLRPGEKNKKKKKPNKKNPLNLHFVLTITKDQVLIQGYAPAPSTPPLSRSSRCQIPHTATALRHGALLPQCRDFPANISSFAPDIGWGLFRIHASLAARRPALPHGVAERKTWQQEKSEAEQPMLLETEGKARVYLSLATRLVLCYRVLLLLLQTLWWLESLWSTMELQALAAAPDHHFPVCSWLGLGVQHVADRSWHAWLCKLLSPGSFS